MYGQGGMSCDSDNVSTIASFGLADEALVGASILSKSVIFPRHNYE